MVVAGAGAADDGYRVGQAGIQKHPVQGRDQLSGSQVAGGPEDDDGAGVEFAYGQAVTDVVPVADLALDGG